MKNNFVSPLSDFVFTEIFGNQQNIDNTKAFLKTLLEIPENEYDRLTVVNPILGKIFRKGKKGVVDLKLTTKSGRIIHIELQVEKRSNMRNRVLYYGARLIGDQINWGDDYEKLNQVVSIVICNHVLLEEESSYFNVYELRNENNNSFTEIMRIFILEWTLPQVQSYTLKNAITKREAKTIFQNFKPVQKTFTVDFLNQQISERRQNTQEIQL